ncbi:MAG: sugar phosphate isomerase/epimerase [Clostridia bacterium]|nr:sugar phosphate isomerase/epimerase [Clostridia bacterium]
MKQNLQLCAFADEAGNRLEEQIAALSENGIPYLEMRGVNGKNVADLTPAEAKDICDRLAANGLRVWSLGSPAGKTKLEVPFTVEEERFKRLLQTADVTGARCIRLFSFYGADDSDACFDEVCRRLNRFLELAQGHSVVLCHENEKGIYGDTAVRCLKLHRALPQLGCVFDPANFMQCGVDTLDAWKLLEPYINYLHIKDCAEDGRVVPPGTGMGHIAELVDLYSKRGGGVMTLEPHLQEFVGLAGLEMEGDKSVVGGIAFESARAAFDCAVNCIRPMMQ